MRIMPISWLKDRLSCSVWCRVALDGLSDEGRIISEVRFIADNTLAVTSLINVNQGSKAMTDKTEQSESSDLVQGWIDRSALNAIQMSEDENYRQLVSARATNWGKDIRERSDQRIRQSQAPHLEI